MALLLHDRINELSDGERALLDIIWREGPISRKALAKRAGVTGASATRLTRRPAELGIIEEAVLREGAVGNPTRPLARVAGAATTIGVSFTRTAIHIGLSDLSGACLEKRTVPVSGITLETIGDAIQSLIDSPRYPAWDRNRLLGIGLAVPGYRASREGRWAVHWDFPALLQTDVAAELSALLGHPVYAERDAVAAGWAERMNGRGREIDDFCLIYLAQGVGGVLFHRGQPMLGAHGNAGGLGVLFPVDQVRPSAQSLQDHLAAQGLQPTDVDPNTIPKTSKTQAAIEGWIASIAPDLAEQIGVLGRLYDTEEVVLGGPLPKFVLKRIVAALPDTGFAAGYTDSLARPHVTVSEVQGESLATGAAIVPIARLLRLA